MPTSDLRAQRAALLFDFIGALLSGAWDLLTYDLTTFKKAIQNPAVAAF